MEDFEEGSSSACGTVWLARLHRRVEWMIKHRNTTTARALGRVETAEM